MAQVKSGRIVLAFCWAHVRRDFVGVGKSWSELTPWALSWLRRIRHVYAINRERLRHSCDSAKFQEQDALLHQAVESIRVGAVEELSDAKLRQPCRKVLESLQEHWTGLIRFVDDPHIPMDNNASERAGRGPAVARKNFYGSGSLWSGQLAAMMFSLLATLARWKINPRRWLTWYLENCAVLGGKAPQTSSRSCRGISPTNAGWRLVPQPQFPRATTPPDAARYPLLFGADAGTFPPSPPLTRADSLWANPYADGLDEGLRKVSS